MSSSFKTLLSARLVPPYSGSRPRALALRGGPIRGKLYVRYVEERLGLFSSLEIFHRFIFSALKKIDLTLYTPTGFRLEPWKV